MQIWLYGLDMNFTLIWVTEFLDFARRLVLQKSGWFRLQDAIFETLQIGLSSFL